MRLEFAFTFPFDLLDLFAERFKVQVFKNSVVIPASIGRGFIKRIDIEPNFKLFIHHYTLKQDFVLKREPSRYSSDYVSIVFNGRNIPTSCISEKKKAVQFLNKNEEVIEISSAALATESVFLKRTEVCFAEVLIRKSLLASILKIEEESSLIQEILYESDTFFFHANMSVEEKKILQQLLTGNQLSKLSTLYYRIKVEELLHLLFSQLLKRGSCTINSVNHADLRKLFDIRNAIIKDLSLQPNLSELSQLIAIGEGRMKQLFKETFGETIYNYYQRERMREAAFLIKQAGHTVSETGYILGFTNLSHFGRLFKKHYGVTPKKYSYTC